MYSTGCPICIGPFAYGKAEVTTILRAILLSLLRRSFFRFIPRFFRRSTPVIFQFIGFIVLGEAAIVAGAVRKWGWVRNRAFRAAHLAAIGVVVLQSWFGFLCPLTRWEDALRRSAGGDGYDQTFVGYWVGRMVYVDAPAWVFTVVYTLFGALVIATWLLARPAGPRVERS